LKKIFPAKWQSVGEVLGDDLTLHLSPDLSLSGRAWLSQIRWEGPTKEGAYFLPPAPPASHRHQPGPRRHLPSV